MKLRSLLIILYISIFVLPVITSNGMNRGNDTLLRISLQQMLPSDLDSGSHFLANEVQHWNSNESAIIVCDMWDKHWCNGASARIAEMAPAINRIVSMSREQGVLIIHAPSGCMNYYEDHPARKTGSRYIDNRVKRVLSEDKLIQEREAIWPFDQSDGGCDCQTPCEKGNPWEKQTELISIFDGDVISDSGGEIAGLFQKMGIKNVILLGGHTNRGVIDRSFGLRNMKRLGYNVVLMRDLTDTLFDSKQCPGVSHFTGNSLMNSYIEKYVCPTMVSSDITGEKQFRFRDDQRPVVAFISAEGEYRTNQRFPEFAYNFLIKNNINCEFALGKPVMKGDGRHNIENLQILNDADMAVIAVRRRALEQKKMELIKEFVVSGKPVLGIRVASHAFDAKLNVPGEGGNPIPSGEQSPEYLEQWPEFDEEVLGGNYQGHHGHLKEGTDIALVPGMENHPLLAGINPEGFVSPSWLYKNRPLLSENIQVILTGKIPEAPVEPVMWVNNRPEGKLVYTSLGHWDDWEIDDFNNLIVNSINYLLKNK